MNKLYFISLLLFATTIHVFAQDRGISYQAVAIDADGKQIPGYDVYGNPIPDAEISVRFGLYDNNDILEYEETHQTLTDQYGLFNLVIGEGTSANNGLYTYFEDIVWSMDKKFLKVELDVYGGSDYKLMSYQELLSVPFAKFAENSLNPGPTGVSVVNSYIDTNGVLIITLSDSTVINAGVVEGPQGIQGLSGSTGATGPAGANGVDGVDGAPGATGPAGANGVDGVDGAPGAIGPAGINGVDGVDGAPGATGPAGINGVDGVDGAPGATGPAGANGVDGVDGAPGATGPAGANGVDGVDGAPGATGPAGNDGVDGNDGAVGATGPAGNDGVDGNDGAVGATGPAGNDGVDGMDAVVDYDSLANLISVDSTFIITVGGGMGGGCNWEFPDGLNGEPIIIGPTMVNGGTINYTVPIGSNLYITAMFSPNAGVEAKVNGMIITNAEMNTQYGVKNAGPWYLGEGDVLELGFEMTAFCLLVDAQVEPKTLSPNPNGYIIPSGKIFYLSEAFIEQSGGYVTVNGNEILIGYVNHASTNYLNPSGPWILKSGDILNTNGSTQTINGYLADENYFAGCGGGGSSSATSNATIDSLSQVVSHLDSSLTALTSLLTFGCTDASALNYDPIANTDNGLCTYAPLAIGNFYQGGIIFYLDGNGGGLVCLVNDINIDLEWGCWGYPMPGADGTAIGTGFQNTIDIVNANCSFGGNGIGIAANICENLTHEGYSDWFLPSKDELNQMFINKDIINLGSGIAFGSILGYTYYWSSTEGDDFNACLQDFTNGNQYCNAGTKYGVNGVRAIRAF